MTGHQAQAPIAGALLNGFILRPAPGEIVLALALASLVVSALLANIGFWSTAIGVTDVTDALLVPISIAWFATAALFAVAVVTSCVAILRTSR